MVLRSKRLMNADLTDSGRAVIADARELAWLLQHPYGTPEHLFYGVSRSRGAATKVLASSGITPEAVRREITRLVGTGIRSPRDPRDCNPPFIPSATRLLEAARQEARKGGAQQTNAAHIALATLSRPSPVIADILTALDADPRNLHAKISRRLSSGSV
jgi:ATP-dependent Clp protease ATP-binding subunit ClpC